MALSHYRITGCLPLARPTDRGTALVMQTPIHPRSLASAAATAAAADLSRSPEEGERGGGGGRRQREINARPLIS